MITPIFLLGVDVWKMWFAKMSLNNFLELSSRLNLRCHPPRCLTTSPAASFATKWGCMMNVLLSRKQTWIWNIHEWTCPLVSIGTWIIRKKKKKNWVMLFDHVLPGNGHHIEALPTDKLKPFFQWKRHEKKPPRKSRKANLKGCKSSSLFQVFHSWKCFFWCTTGSALSIFHFICQAPNCEHMLAFWAPKGTDLLHIWSRVTGKLCRNSRCKFNQVQSMFKVFKPLQLSTSLLCPALPFPTWSCSAFEHPAGQKPPTYAPHRSDFLFI